MKRHRLFNWLMSIDNKYIYRAIAIFTVVIWLSIILILTWIF